MVAALVAVACQPTRYVYDDQGRLKGVTDPDGDTAVYQYDDAGNIVGVDRYPSSQVSVIGFAPRRGSAGDEVVIQGTGFGADDVATQNAVEFNGVEAQINGGDELSLRVLVPEGATSGPITVTSPGGTATSADTFTLEADTAPAISGFTPQVVGIGDQVTISGSNFFGDIALGLDTVSLSGGYADPVSASSTELVVGVPASGSSGQITVSTPEGSAISADDLYVAPAPFTAGDIGDTARVDIGQQTTVSLPTSGQVGLVVFDGQAGQRVSIQVSNDQFSSCEPEVSLLAPGGARLGRLSCALSTLNLMEPVTLPTDGTYSVLVDPGAATGSATLTVHDVQDVIGTITAGGDPVDVTIGTPGQNAVLDFTGVADQRLSLLVTNDTFSSCDPVISVLALDGTELGEVSCAITSPSFIDTFALPDTAGYRVVVDPGHSVTGSLRLTLLNVPDDQTASITPDGAAVDVSVGTPGQNAVLSFDGTADQRFSVALSNDTFSVCSPDVRVLAPDDTVVAEETCLQTTGFVDTFTLPTTGTYRIMVDPDDATTGAVRVQLIDVPDDVSSAITPGGAAVDVSVGTPGQNAVLSFEGTADQRLSVALSNDTFSVCSPDVRVLAPDDTVVAEETCVQTTGFVDTFTLPATGTYRIVVDPDDATTGTVRVQLIDVPDDQTGSITPGGAAVDVTIGDPGQNAVLSFDATADQRLNVVLSSDTFSGCSPDVQVLDVDDTVVASQSCVQTTGFVDTFVVPATGTYRIVVDPDDGTTGSVRVQLVDVPDDQTGSITPGGAAVDVTISIPGQNSVLSFDGSENQRLSVVLSDDTFSSCSPAVEVLDADGDSLGSEICVISGIGFIDTFVLPAAGTYRIRIDPAGAATGTVRVQLVDVPADVTGSLTVGGSPLTVSTASAGQNAEVTFSGTTGQNLRLDLSGDTFAVCSPDVRVLAPNGASVGTLSCPQGTGSVTLSNLPQTGTYRIQVNPDEATTGQITLALVAVSAAAAEAGASDGAAPTRHTGDLLARANTPNQVQRGEPVDPASVEPSSDAEAGEEAWRPDGTDRDTAWVAERDPSEWEDVPLLVPPDGVTAVSGQVLRLNGRPLADVTVAVGEHEARTDETGRFLLRLPDADSGRQELVIDGSSASTDDDSYGTFVVGIEVRAGHPTFVDHTVWMPALDTDHEVELDYPLDEDVVVTTPSIPGLELHIPAGTELRDRDGELVTEVGITPVPIDRTPYPLPDDTEIPIYFTIQPGGAVIEPYGTYLVYPNYHDEAPGSWVSFFEYTPEQGWHVYGKGEVTADGEQIVPDPSVALTELTGAMINAPGYGPPGSGPNGDGSEDGDPVDLGTGLFVYEKTDLVVSDILPIYLTRTYRPNDDAVRAFGRGTTWGYDLYLWSAQQYQEADLILPDGARVHYERTTPGTGFCDAAFEQTGGPTIFNESTITWRGTCIAGLWDLRLKDGTVLVFGDTAPLQAIRDRNGNQITLHRESRNAFGSETGNIVSITSPHGRWLGFSYDDQRRVTEARDHMGRAYSYAYDDQSRLVSVTDPEGGVTEYTYDDQHRMLTVTDPRDITFLTNEYDAEDRVIEQTQADGSTYGFAYTTDADGDVTRTDVTDPRGVVRRVGFTDGFRTSDIRGLGTPEEQSVTFERDPTTHVITSATDQLGRRVAYDYDAAWDLTSLTLLDGTPEAVTTSFTYEPDFHRVASMADPLGRETSYTYDGQGNLDTITDPSGAVTDLDHDARGRVTSLTNPLGAETTFAYDLINRLTVTDARGNGATRFLDAGGRPVLASDPLGDRSILSYDDLNRPLTARGPDGTEITFAYDPNGNITSVTDGEGHATTYTYDEMDRLATRTDPLGATDQYAYDDGGLVTQHTDRRGEVTTFAYDPLGRLTEEAFGVTGSGSESSISYTYDEVSRLTEVDDTAYGTIEMAYDDLSRIVSEATPDGSVDYTYNAAGERLSMQLDDRPEVTYGYDDVGRLESIGRAGASITVTRDDLGRLAGATLPNDVTAAYSYDSGNNLTKILYDSPATGPDADLGSVEYTYDPLGRRATASGDLGDVEIPEPVGQATYDAANRLTERDGTTYSYDAAGNLTGDGTNIYTWNARGQLTEVDGPTSATFAYDPFGRRSSKTVGSDVTDYRYDGANVIQQADGAALTDYVTGLSVDEVLARITADGTTTYLTDGLGSTVGLVDATGTVVTSYKYGPFGETEVSGQADPNPFAYTGRELDETGLYFYRARYYQPSLGRFISQDPARFGSGQLNLYSYVGNDPVNTTDPSGMCGVDAIVDVGFLIYDGWKLFSDGRKNLGENLLAGGADLAGLFIPCATGGGAAVRGATHADDLVDGLRGADNLDDALDASRVGDDIVDGATRCARSFSADTEVVMADGTTKPISEIKVGDEVLATDPATGETAVRTVTATHVMLHDGDLLDVLVRDDDGHGVIQTTDSHPFWSVTDGAWEPAVELSAGEQLRLQDGSTAMVVALTERPGRADMHDLTVEVDHSFYVRFDPADDDAVLVHNQEFQPGTFVNEDGVRITIHANDHGPPHAHVIGGGPETRIGQNGRPIAGSPELTAQQQRVVDNNLSTIRSKIGDYMRWWRQNC